MKELNEVRLETVKEQAARSISDSYECAKEYLESMGIDPAAVGAELSMGIRRANFDRLSSVNQELNHNKSNLMAADLEMYARELVTRSKEGLAKMLRLNVPSFEFRSLDDNGLTSQQMVQILVDAKKADLLGESDQL